LEQNFPGGRYAEGKTITFRRCNVARLFRGEKSQKEGQVRRLLRRCNFGLREVEIAQELGWDRRTVNNYLRALKGRGRAYKEGRKWFIES
jgi:hypothetical protein